ncbi:MAG TPA: sulfotransferase [Actinopolymorphaceae bacterium]
MRLLDISRTEQSTSPVFIVGEARSGTSILYRILQKHPAFRPRKLNLWESRIMRCSERAASFRPEDHRTLRGYMAGDDERYNAFLESIAPLRPLFAAGELMLRLVPERFRSSVWFASGHALVVRSYFHHAREARGVRRVLEKTPNQVGYVRQLLRCYPKARLIYIHRHPVDVYTSYVRRAQVDPKAASWARLTPSTFAARWAENTTLALNAKTRAPRSFLMLRYEDLTENPEATVRSLCEFLGEPFDPDMIRERKPRVGLRKADPHLFGELTATTKDWRDYICPEDAAALQKRLEPIMARLSYQPYEW